MIDNYNIRKIVSTDYALTYLLIAVSGFPYFTNNPNFLIIGFCFALAVFIRRNKKFTRFYIGVLLFLLLLVIGQTISFNYINPRTTVSLFIRWSFPFFVVSAIGPRFLKYYIDIIFLHVLISFLFFLPSVVIPEFETFLLNNIAIFFEQESTVSIYDYNSNILVYTIKTSGGDFNVMRNSGPFWEAGAFAGYVLIAFMFNVLIQKRVWSTRNLIFIVAIGSTVSTTGFLATSIFLILYYILQSVRRPVFIVVSIAVLIGSLSLYSRIEMINLKIQATYEEIEDTDYQSDDRTRIVSAKLDFEDIKKNFLVGKGRHSITRYGTSEIGEFEHRNNGITDLIVKYGVFFGLFYFINIWISLRKLCLITYNPVLLALIIIFVIIILGFSETYFQQSLFITLIFIRELFPHRIHRLELRSNNSHIQ